MYDLVIKKSLTLSEKGAVEALQLACYQAEDLQLKLELDYKAGQKSQNQDEFLLYDQDRLIAYLGICGFGGHTLELSGMVDPAYRRQGCFSRLVEAFYDSLSQRAYKTLLLLNDRRSEAGRAFIESRKGAYRCSEYEMVFKGTLASDDKKGLVLRPARNEDREEIRQQNEIYWDRPLDLDQVTWPEEDLLSGFITYLGQNDHGVVGKVSVQRLGDRIGIFGLGVKPAYRKKGYGRALLASVMRLEGKGADKTFFLQVETKNDQALGLYQSLGFKTDYIMDYYEVTLDRRG